MRADPVADATEDWPVVVWADTAARGNVRKWRLHACGCSRASFGRRRVGAFWLRLLELAERYADGEATADELAAGRARYSGRRKPLYLAGPSGDFSLAFHPDETLDRTWQEMVIAQRREYRPGGADYALVLSRFRVLQELIGPDPLPAFDPGWRSDTVMSLARGAYGSRDYAVMPILADALQDAGCDDAAVLGHCRDPGAVHVRGCWVLDLILGRW